MKINELSTKNIVFLLLFLVPLVYFQFLQSEKYGSDMIIGVTESEASKRDSADLTQLGLLSIQDSEIYELKDYLYSDEGLSMIMNTLILIEDKIKEPSFIDLEFQGKSQKQILKNMIDIKISEESQNMFVATKAFSAQNAKAINISIIQVARNYFNEQINQNAFLESSNSICALAALSNNSKSMLFIETDFIKDSLEANKGMSYKNLLLDIYNRKREFCLTQFEESENEILKNILPTAQLANLESNLEEGVMEKFFDSVSAPLQESNRVKVISEPSISEKSVPKRSVLFSFIFLLVGLLGYSAVVVAIKLFRS